MKIYLYLKSKIITFALPQKVYGSFSFDENFDEESKLINVEAIDESWYLYSTTESVVVSNGAPVEKEQIKAGNFYIIRRSNVDYLVYIANTFDDSFLPYKYGDDLNLIIGNINTCNVNYNCPFIDGVVASISVENKQIILKPSNTSIYLNDISCKVDAGTYIIKSGDQIHVFGLKIVFLNGFLLINNPRNLVTINFASSKLTSYELRYGVEPKDFQVKDEDLYNKNDYFSKSPRLRRQIQTKEIDLSPPPNQQKPEKLPFILTIGPMLTMGIMSAVMVANTITNITSGKATLASSWPQLVTASSMLISMILWPTLTKIFNNRLKKQANKELIEKYGKYLEEKEKEFIAEQKLQKDILIENLIPVETCVNIINNAKVNFWDKRIDQNDFLEVRMGIGNALLDVDVNLPKDGFTIEEDELKKQASALVEKYKYIMNVPIRYSFFESKVTAFMGNKEKCYGLLNNIILQLLTFYSYEDIKLVIITNKVNESNWEYARYLNHTFSNSKDIRFFSTDAEYAKNLCDYLNYELQMRLQQEQINENVTRPYYFIITDDYKQIKRHSFVKAMTETDDNAGFSLIILENQMSKLPSKCSNFINMSSGQSGILRDSYESQEQVPFQDEINYGIDMMQITSKLANIPIEFEEGNGQLPESITFLEMERVGNVEQLNIMNRWDTNDSTTSLKAEVGVDSEGSLMYLDLHEKYHGPHGLIAGMTGSGKSEFIITYILSMAINYSPDDVAFILIDYKGGGLAFAFENKTTGVSLPHLAGTITNLDKAEMDRTLVSIDSEIKRRQKIFNDARDKLGESTIDIYKYQRFFKDGKLDEPIPHLFIICDEFAELKAQQPDFMDNLISVARIGRSLGVHLILATQKPSGVVNDQIWSNTKFRVCLKVQDASDSKEMIKRPEAASLKQAGRFYLQVGYDEYFALGQSGWCGAKYFPSDKIVKQVDKSVSFINDNGIIIKSAQASNNTAKLEAQGEQLAAIMNTIIEISKTTNKKVNKLWLSDIDPIILVDNLEIKYEYEAKPYEVEAIIGEYDAPENQEQGLLKYSLKEDGNTIIYGNDEIEKEGLLCSMIYSICKHHPAEEINFYVIDYGSEQLRMFNNFPQFGGMVFVGEDEKFKNLIRLINNEIKTRKQLLIPYGGSIDTYNSKNETKLPQIIVIFNNFESINELNQTLFEDLPPIARECERYGINIIITATQTNSVGRRISQSFNNSYALHITDTFEYASIFNKRVKNPPRDTLGRGLVNNGEIHEFQSASIVDEETDLNEFLLNMEEELKKAAKCTAKPIPVLPEEVTIDTIENEISNLTKVPIGISKDTLKAVKYNFTTYKETSVISNKLDNINSFIDSLTEVFLRIPNLVTIFIDATEQLSTIANKKYDYNKVNYYANDLDSAIAKLSAFEDKISSKTIDIVYIIYGIDKLRKIVNTEQLDTLLEKITKSENSYIVMCDSAKNMKNIELESWFANFKNNSDGVWIGTGISDQQNFRLSKISKEMTQPISNEYGYNINEANGTLIKLIAFNSDLYKGDEEDE